MFVKMFQFQNRDRDAQDPTVLHLPVQAALRAARVIQMIRLEAVARPLGRHHQHQVLKILSISSGVQSEICLAAMLERKRHVRRIKISIISSCSNINKRNSNTTINCNSTTISNNNHIITMAVRVLVSRLPQCLNSHRNPASTTQILRSVRDHHHNQTNLAARVAHGSPLFQAAMDA